MTDFIGAVMAHPGTVFSTATQTFAPGLYSSIQCLHLPTALDGTAQGTGNNLVEARAQASRVGRWNEGPSDTWFEIVHVNPETFMLGNVLASSSQPIELYNAHRHTDLQMSAAENGAGDGITFTGLPTLPLTLPAQNGLPFYVQVGMNGPSSIDGYLTFTFDLGTVLVAVTGTRVAMVVLEPEVPITEQLQWLTTIMQAIDGTEQRQRKRRYPRQIFNMIYRVATDNDWRSFRNALFGFHPGTFGLPMWHEARLLTAPVTLGDTTVYLDTRYADFRAGGSVMLWKSPSSYDALTVVTVNEDSLVLESGTTQAYTVDETLVLPLRTAVVDSSLSADKHTTGLEDWNVVFTVLDNETDFADSSSYLLHNSKVLLDDPNRMDSTLPDGLFREMGRLDNEVGVPVQYSDWDASRSVTRKSWVCNTPAQVWRVRQLLHALRGSAVSFYMPTFYPDLVAVAFASDSLDIERCGYTSFVLGREPQKSLWLELTDGSIVTRQVVGQEVIDGTTERLTVDTGWPYSIDPANVVRISFLRLCRIADDEVVLEHHQAGAAIISANVLAVQT